jgi:ABC-type Mn2+/Zn2+ transport system ATPase subunit
MIDPRFPYSRGRHAEPKPNAPAVATERLSACYPGTTVFALREVSLSAPKGTLIALVGSNGAGKSTLLKAISGLLPVESGDVKIFGNPVGACHHRVCYLPQRGDIDWALLTLPVLLG